MNSEYEYWKNYFKKEEVALKIKELILSLKGKRILFYPAGNYFDALFDLFSKEMKESFKILGVCDLKFEKQQDNSKYKGLLCFKPSEIKLLEEKNEFDRVFLSTSNFKSLKKTLLLNGVFKESSQFSYLKSDEEKINKKIKENYEKKILELRKKIKSKEKIKVAFVLEENSKWSYGNLYFEFKNNPNFELLPVFLFPIITKNRIEYTQKENFEFLKEKGIESIDFYDYENKKNKDIASFSPDIVFYSQPWYLMNVNHPEIVSNYALTVMVPYGYTTLSKENWGSDNVKEIYRSLWKFFSESEYHNKFYKDVASMEDNLVAVGSLKFDNYKINLSDKKSLWKGKKGAKKIIYAPHHSIKNNGLKMSNFDRDYLFFLNFAKNNPQYSFVFKPHPALKSMCAFEGIMTEDEYEAYISSWNNLQNAIVYDKGDYFEIFKTSDILITDCSSFLAEYFPTKNPIIFLNRPDRAPFDEFGEKIKKGFYELYDTNSLEELLKKLLLEGKDELYNTRKDILKNVFFLPSKLASRAIVEYLEKNIVD